MKTCARVATGSTIQSRVDPRPLQMGDRIPAVLRHVPDRRPPRPAPPDSYATHIVTWYWLAVARQLGRAAFGLRPVAVPPLLVASRPTGFALPRACVAR